MNETTDRPILEEVAVRGNLNPIHIAEGINGHRNYVVNRLRFLEEVGLVENLGHGLYSISEKGERYLEGGLDTSESGD